MDTSEREMGVSYSDQVADFQCSERPQTQNPEMSSPALRLTGAANEPLWCKQVTFHF